MPRSDESKQGNDETGRRQDELARGTTKRSKKVTQRNVETTKRSKEVTQRNDETTKRKHETTTQTFCPGFDFIPLVTICIVGNCSGVLYLNARLINAGRI